MAFRGLLVCHLPPQLRRGRYGNMLRMLSTSRPAHSNGVTNFFAHTIHWGDFPTWLAAVGGVAAAIYAARAFRGVARQQALNDRIMRYQAYSQARQMVTGVGVRVFPTSPQTPSLRRVELWNQSQHRIDTIRLTALIGGDPCTMHVTVDTNMPEQTSRRDPGAVLSPNSKAIWELSQDKATVNSHLACFFQFRDEAGGFWAIDDESHLTIDEDYTKVRPPRGRNLWSLLRRLPGLSHVGKGGAHGREVPKP